MSTNKPSGERYRESMIIGNKGLVIEADGRIIDLGIINNGSRVIVRGRSPQIVLGTVNNDSRVVVAPGTVETITKTVNNRSSVWVPESTKLIWEPPTNGSQIYVYRPTQKLERLLALPHVDISGVMMELIKVEHTSAKIKKPESQGSSSRSDSRSSVRPFDDGIDSAAAIFFGANILND